MEIGQKFNQLTLDEYFFYIDNYKKYKDFNTLGQAQLLPTICLFNAGGVYPKLSRLGSNFKIGFC